MAEIALLGAGSWGTALAVHLAGIGHAPRLLFRGAEAAARARSTRRHEVYLPGYTLPPTVLPTADPVEALSGASLVLVTTPVKGLDLAIEWLRGRVPPTAPIVSCAKGIRPGTLETPLAALARALPETAARLAVLSGPTFAVELARGDPSAAVVAAAEPTVARHVQSVASGGHLRLYANDDPIGVEWAGALKNVVAIAAGVVDGLGWGMNTTAALITRGLAEMTRMGVAMGGRPSTFAGLAGLGDLVLTCTGRWSRNRAVGRDLALGRALPEIVDGSPMVAEGVLTAAAARARALEAAVDMPIVNEVAGLLFDGRRPADALAALLARDLKDEERYHGGGGGPTGA